MALHIFLALYNCFFNNGLELTLQELHILLLDKQLLSAHMKFMLLKQKRGCTVSPQEQLDNAVYTLNFLNCAHQQLNTTAGERHFGTPPHFLHWPQVLYRDFPSLRSGVFLLN